MMNEIPSHDEASLQRKLRSKIIHEGQDVANNEPKIERPFMAQQKTFDELLIERSDTNTRRAEVVEDQASSDLVGGKDSREKRKRQGIDVINDSEVRKHVAELVLIHTIDRVDLDDASNKSEDVGVVFKVLDAQIVKDHGTYNTKENTIEAIVQEYGNWIDGAIESREAARDRGSPLIADGIEVLPKTKFLQVEDRRDVEPRLIVFASMIEENSGQASLKLSSELKSVGVDPDESTNAYPSKNKVSIEVSVDGKLIKLDVLKKDDNVHIRVTTPDELVMDAHRIDESRLHEILQKHRLNLQTLIFENSAQSLNIIDKGGNWNADNPDLSRGGSKRNEDHDTNGESHDHRQKVARYELNLDAVNSPANVSPSRSRVGSIYV